METQHCRMLCYTGTLAETSIPLSYQDSCLWVMWLMVTSVALIVIGLLVHLCCPEMMILLLGDKVVWDTMLIRIRHWRYWQRHHRQARQTLIWIISPSKEESSCHLQDGRGPM